MKLAEYHKKRDFKKTSEPKGLQKESDITSDFSHNIFVVQKHQASHLHYDFRLEIDGVLKSWAIPKGPSVNPKDKRLAIMTEDHPLEYANFEGIIPEGEYGAGVVKIWDKGTWEPVNDAREGLAQKKLEFILHGERLNGIWVLIGFKNKPKDWLLIKKSLPKYSYMKMPCFKI